MQDSTINLQSIRNNIAKRVRSLCANMSEEEFEKLVARMALIEWRHLRLTGEGRWNSSPK
jgi:hypothetical protein